MKSGIAAEAASQTTAARRALYRDALLDHGKAPRNHAPLAGATHAAAVDNSLCGDRVRVELTIEDGRVRDARFTIKGCLLATASASLMTEAVTGHPLAWIEQLYADVEATCHGEPTSHRDGRRPLGALSELAAVREYPARRRCATLPWVALRLALEQDEV